MRLWVQWLKKIRHDLYNPVVNLLIPMHYLINWMKTKLLLLSNLVNPLDTNALFNNLNENQSMASFNLIVTLIQMPYLINFWMKTNIWDLFNLAETLDTNALFDQFLMKTKLWHLFNLAEIP